MKKALFLFNLLIPIICFSQTPRQYIGTTNNIVEARGGLMADSAFYFGVHDTTFTPDRIGCVIQRPQDNLSYIYSTFYGATHWYPYYQSIGPLLFGPLYNNNSWPTLTTDWTNNGTMANIVSNKIEVSGGNQSISATVGTNNAAFNQFLRLYPGYGYSMLEKVKFSVKIKMNSVPGASTTGVAIGKISTNSLGLPSNSMCYFNMSTGTGTGKAFLLTGALNTTTASTSTSLPLNQDNYYLLTWEKNLNRVTVSVKDMSLDTAIISSWYTYDLTSASNPLIDNTGTFGVASLGGTFTIDSVSLESNEVKNASLMCIGDSKLTGYNSLFDFRIVSRLNTVYFGTVGRGGQSDKTSDIINALPEAIALHPNIGILELGRNDIYAGVPQSTYGPNIDTIFARLERSGTVCYLVDAFYETSLNQDSLKAYINEKYGLNGTISPNRVIHTYQLGAGQSGTLSTDNVHPSTFGNQVYTNAIINSLKIHNNSRYLNDVNNIPFRVQTFDSASILGTLKVGLTGSTYYLPNQYNQNDIIMQRDGGIVSSNLSASNFKNRITILNSTNGGMDFRNYQAGSFITFYTVGSGSTGSQTAALTMPSNGAMRITNALAGITASFGDIYIPVGKSLGAAGGGTVGLENKITLYNSSNGDMEFRGYTDGSDFRWFVSDSVPGGQRNAMTLRNSNGYLGLRYTVPIFTLDVNGTIGGNKDSIPHITSIGTNELLTLDTSSRQFKRILASDLSLYTFNNGLTNTSGTVQLGGTLVQNTTINTGGFTSTWTGSNDSETSFSVANTGATNAHGISGSATGTSSIGVTGTSTSYLGVYGSSTSNNGVQGESSSGSGVVGISATGVAFRGQTNPISTDAIENVASLLRRSSSGAGANGLGAAIQVELETATNGTSQTAGSFGFKWTDATNATRTSQAFITAVDTATTNTVATYDGDGTYTTIGKRIIKVITNSDGTLTLGNAHNYVFTGTTTTWTLPAVSGTTGLIYYIKNRGSGAITLNADSGSNEIYDTAAANTYNIAAGAAITIISDGTYFNVYP